jgi:hypothetical protein
MKLFQENFYLAGILDDVKIVMKNLAGNFTKFVKFLKTKML